LNDLAVADLSQAAAADDAREFVAHLGDVGDLALYRCKVAARDRIDGAGRIIALG
jgi:hypothetical protein